MPSSDIELAGSVRRILARQTFPLICIAKFFDGEWPTRNSQKQGIDRKGTILLKNNILSFEGFQEMGMSFGIFTEIRTLILTLKPHN